MSGNVKVPNLPGMRVASNNWHGKMLGGANFSKTNKPLSNRGKDHPNQDVKDVFHVGPTEPMAERSAKSTSAPISLLDMVKEKQPDLVARPRPKNSKFGPESPREGVKLAPPSVPAHVLNDKQVLRFYGLFSESRPWDEEAPLGKPKMESEIYRYLTIAYYIEDDTLSFNEGAPTNGMSGGSFASRDIYTKKDGKTRYSLTDLSVGETIFVRGQDVMIYDADQKTRDYYRKEFMQVMAPALHVPERIRTDHGVAFATGGAAVHLPPPKDPNEEGNYRQRSAEYEKNKARSDKTREFHKNDTRVFRFESMLVGDGAATIADKILNSSKKYSVSYYLADNTMDIRLVKDKRSGYDETPSLFKRAKLAKNWKDVLSGQSPIYYAPSDLICGNIIECIGRSLKLVDCDPFTRRTYEEMGMLQIPVSTMSDAPVHKIPKRGDGFLAIGSEEDTLGTVHGQPKPMKDMKKLAKFQGQTLRASARIISERAGDRAQERLFTATFYLEDDTLQIFEEVKANTGSSGGNFLKRGKYYNELPEDCDEPRYFTSSDFYLGNVFSVHKREMRIVDMDETSLQICESQPEIYSLFDPMAVVAKHIDEVASSRLDVRAEIMKYDRRKCGLLPKELLLHALEDIGLIDVVNDQEVLTLLRRIKNGDKYEYFELCDMFSQVYYKKNVGSPRVSARGSGKGLQGEPSAQALLNMIKGNKASFRKILRTDTSLAGFTTLARLSYLFKRAGLNLTVENKAFISGAYGVSDREASMYLPQLTFPKEEELESEADVPAISRLDIKSTSRMASSSSRSFGPLGVSVLPATPTLTDIQRRRTQLHVSVLKPSGQTRRAAEGPESADSIPEGEDSVVISYKSLCDDVYKFDWL